MWGKRKEPSAWEQRLTAKQTTRTEVAQELVKMHREMAGPLLESLREQAGLAGKAFTDSAEDMFLFDITHILTAFVQANGSGTKELADILSKVVPQLQLQFSNLSSQDHAVEFLTRLPQLGEVEPSIPAAVKGLKLFDDQHRTNFAPRAAKVYAKLITVACEQGISTYVLANTVVRDKYLALLIPYIDGPNEDRCNVEQSDVKSQGNAAYHLAVNDGGASHALEILEVRPTCTDQELKSAYLGKIKQWHPDNFHSMAIPKQMKELAEQETAKINNAYQFLLEFRASSRVPE